MILFVLQCFIVSLPFYFDSILPADKKVKICVIVQIIQYKVNLRFFT